jgi:hypothetical protein
MVEKICQKCGKSYFLGYTGVVDGCDKCMGIQRDKGDFAWYPDENEHTYAPVDGSPEFTVKRSEVL